MMKTLKYVVAAAAVASSMPAAAVTVTTIAANFSTPVGGTDPIYANNDGIAGNEVFQWGQPATSAGKNALTFASTAVPLSVLTDSQFSLGTLSYTNQATYGTALTSLQLSLTATISGSATPLVFLFGLGIDETPNIGTVATCPYPSVTPCSDRVTVSTLNGSGTFVSGGTTYTLFIDGFQDGNGAFSTNFYGQETTTTTATVIGRFAAAPVATSGVPEPASWAMLIAGFGLIGGAMRRPRRVGVRFG